MDLPATMERRTGFPEDELVEPIHHSRAKRTRRREQGRDQSGEIRMKTAEYRAALQAHAPEMFAVLEEEETLADAATRSEFSDEFIPPLEYMKRVRTVRRVRRALVEKIRAVSASLSDDGMSAPHITITPVMTSGHDVLAGS
jgi:hypothetical protein